MRMHHERSDARLLVTDDPDAQVMTIRIGPVNLPAHADHMSVAQPRWLYLTIPFSGWAVAYHPRLVDDTGTTIAAKLIHHVAFWSMSRSDFLCPNKPEHVFGAGGEMNDWPVVPGFGYRVTEGDKIRIDVMFHNPTDAPYAKTYLEIRMEYRRVGRDVAPLQNVYPAWFDVMQCRSSAYDLKPGVNVTDGLFTVDYSGTLLGVGGHLHDFGESLVLEDVTRRQTIATLDPTTDSAGRLISMPVVRFPAPGYSFEKGEIIRVTAAYDNTTGKRLLGGAMGIAVGYFLPADSEQFDRLSHRRK